MAVSYPSEFEIWISEKKNHFLYVKIVILCLFSDCDPVGVVCKDWYDGQMDGQTDMDD